MNLTSWKRPGSLGMAAACVLVGLVAALPPWPARSQPTTGSLTGTVLAQNGVGLPGAVVTLTPSGANKAIRAIAGDRGVFRGTALPPGTYTILAEARGFEPATLSSIVLASGETREVTLTLRASGVEERVTVIGNSPSDSLEAVAIRESPARDPAEALSSVAGVWKLRKGGIANDTVVRGLQTKDLNVLIDGQRIYGACPGHMDPPSFHADFAEVDRIEVAKGPFDVKNQGSLGGVVNIVTKDPEKGFHASANMAAGSASYLNPSATVSFASDAVTALGGFSWKAGEAYKDGDGRRFTEITNYKASVIDKRAFEVGTVWGKAGFRPANDHFVELSYTHQEATDVFYPALLMDGTWDRSDRVNLGYEAALGGSVLSTIRAQGYYTRVNHWMTDEYRTSAGTLARGYSMATLAHSRTAGGKVEAKLLSGVTTGVEVFERFWETVNEMAMSGYVPSYSLPSASTRFAGVYAEWNHPLSGTLSLGLGGRYDWARSEVDPEKANTNLYYAYNGTRSTSRTDSFPSGSVRLVYRPGMGIEVSGGVGSNVRVPEPNERYYALKRMGVDWVGDPELDPSRNTGLDLAFSYRRSGLALSLNMFANHVGDYITVHEQKRVNMAPGIMNTQARSYANVDADLYGGELGLSASLPWHLFVSGDVSYVRGTQDADPAKSVYSTNLSEMPPFRGRTALRFDTGRVWIEAEGVFSAAQENVAEELEEMPTPGWGIANLRLGANLASFSVTAGIGNLFDRLYYESLSYQRDPYRTGVKVPEPGRNVFVNVSYKY
ncbi:MAG: Vitamin B12 transporter BtuB [Thermoanaerobaculia bacterium]|nr:Vitamin B12 transporter BtuB [Thermoanaerobaculia bacterium]